MQTDKKTISLSKAAVVAGTTILLLVLVAPFAEIFVFPKLVGSGTPQEAFENVTSNLLLFKAAIFAYAITFTGDVIIAWALYLLLKPVNESVSLLAALFRLIFAIISLIALLDLITAFRLVKDTDYLTSVAQADLSVQLYFLLQTFKYGYHFGIVFFAAHLGLLGYLVYRSAYIPKILGILLIISACGYLTSSLKPFLFPDLNTGIITVTFFGEVIFMLWLLIRGHKIPHV